MSNLTDLEVVKLCAQAMGYQTDVDEISAVYALCEADFPDTFVGYDPLNNREQAMELAERFDLILEPDEKWAATWINRKRERNLVTITVRHKATLCRAISVCVAEMELEKMKITPSSSPDRQPASDRTA